MRFDGARVTDSVPPPARCRIKMVRDLERPTPLVEQLRPYRWPGGSPIAASRKNGSLALPWRVRQLGERCVPRPPDAPTTTFGMRRRARTGARSPSKIEVELGGERMD